MSLTLHSRRVWVAPLGWAGLFTLCQLLLTIGLLLIAGFPQVGAPSTALRRVHPGFVQTGPREYSVGPVACLETPVGVPYEHFRRSHQGRLFLAMTLMSCWSWLDIETGRGARVLHMAEAAVQATPPISRTLGAGQTR